MQDNQNNNFFEKNKNEQAHSFEKSSEEKVLNSEFENALKELRQKLIIEGYSDRTIKMYTLYNQEILYSINKPIKEITSKDLMGYLADKKEKGCENSTLALIHSGGEYFFKKYLKMNILDEIKIPKKAKTLPKIPSKIQSVANS